MSKLPKFSEKKPYYLTLFVCLALSAVLLLGSLVTSITGSGDDWDDEYSSETSISLGSTCYGYSGDNTYKFYASNGSGTYRVVFTYGSYNVESITVKYYYDDITVDSGYSSGSEYSFYISSGYSYYTLEIEADGMFDFYVEYYN